MAAAICGHADLPAAAQNYHPNAAVGDVPAPWNQSVESYQLADILRLVIFYNDNFGIEAGDLVRVRRTNLKVLAWLLDE